MSRAWRRPPLRRISAALALLLAASGARAASLYDSAFRFQQLRTPHFAIYFHQGEDRLARRLAVVAEETWRAVGERLQTVPPALTRVVLVDQTELANGTATPVPYDTVVVSAAWPAAYEFIGDTDDWLRLVFAHEFTHIVHLDRSHGWARAARGIFGRLPVAFPNLFLPTWQVEGLATYEESAITGTGRLHAGDFRAIVGEAARAHRLEPIDRVNGGLTDWPGGEAPYAYGLGFHAYLADRFGAGRFAALADATAGRVPFTAAPVFQRVYGEGLGRLWRDYESAVRAAAPSPPPPGARRLTEQGFVAAGPRFAPPACDGCPPVIIYSRRTPHGFPTLNRLALDGATDEPLTTRYLGSTSAPARAAIVFDQQEVRRDAGLYSDLYVLERTSGRVRRLTREARLLDPDRSPDGATLACVQDAAPGRRDLVLVALPPGPPAAAGPIRTLLSAPDTAFAAPRWSPDGRLIAVERHRLGARPDVVLVDAASGRVLASIGHPRARLTTPAWRPDGAAIVAAADVDGPFELYEIPLAGALSGTPAGRRLTASPGGAIWPDVSPDGATLVYAADTSIGYDIFEQPYPDTSPAPAIRLSSALPIAQPASAATAAPAPPYSPLPTLAPTFWSPMASADSQQVRIGAATGGTDVLGYHAYAVSATWLASAPAGAADTLRAEPDWSASYAYARWRPTFWAAAASDTSFFAGAPLASGAPPAATERERSIEAGVLWPIAHVRVSQALVGSVIAASDAYTLGAGRIVRDRVAARGGWTISSAHTYGYSISPEGGVTAAATIEATRRALGAFADATTVTGDLRVYAPAPARHHVIALRVAGGASTGSPDAGRVFHLGGAAPDASPLDFGHDAISLLRAFPADAFAGTRVALANADYRWPIARPQRGIRTWPIFLHTVHAAVFADAGNVWTRRFSLADVKTDAGAELSADVVAGYRVRFTLTLGAAWGLHGADTAAWDRAVYFRLGRAF